MRLMLDPLEDHFIVVRDFGGQAKGAVSLDAFTGDDKIFSRLWSGERVTVEVTVDEIDAGYTIDGHEVKS